MLRMVSNLWKIAAEIDVNGRIPLKLYQSNRSALRVAVADVTGPMVKGMISFVTETDCDDGLPHTLEHLVFMGSERFPYKGVLDVIANRCLASGTNASTDQDNTSYTLNTVDSRGFIKVLPVYLDHLLSPMLTHSQFMTEVHHINGEGVDAGVVYSEMQDHESEMEGIVDRVRREIIYPPNNSYRVSFAGRLSNLRTTCTVDRVRDYHKRYYHLHNMMIIVCGCVDHAALLAAIEPVEARELAKVPSDFQRPFSVPPPPIKGEHVRRVVCPSDDDSKGVVDMAWLVGSASENLYKQMALLVLFDYLSDTAVSPLQRDFVQLEDPYCSSVYVSMSEQTRCEIVMSFSGVPTKQLENIRHRFFNKTMVDHSESGAWDTQRFGYIIDQSIKRYLTNMENNASSQIFNSMVCHLLYDNDAEHGGMDALRIRLNEIATLRQLKMEPASFWHELFHATFTSDYACVIGEPNTAAVEELTKQEEARIEEQRKRLGKEGLKKCEKQLREAIKENTARKPTVDVLNEFIVKDFKRFNTFNITTINNLESNNAISSPFSNLPFTVVCHTVPSDFIDMVLLIDTKDVPVKLRHYLMLWFELFFQSPAVIDGEKLSFEEVSKLSTRDLVSNSVSIGINDVYDRFVSLRLRVDAPNYKNLPKWTETYLYNILFDAKRVAVCAKKLTSAAAESKRDGSNVCAFLSTAFTYNNESNTGFYNYIALEKFHKNIAKQLDNDSGGQNAIAVVDALERIRSAILACPMNLHVACDPSKVPADDVARNAELWAFMLPQRAPIFGCSPTFGLEWSNVGQSNALAVGGTESSFLLQKTEFPIGWSDETLMETMLLVQYLTQCEGLLWNGVRGEGLAYDASIYVLPDRGALTLNLYRCSQLAHAYEQTEKVVKEIIDSGRLDELQFEGAKRSLVCELISAQSTIKSAAVNAILRTVRRIDPDFVMTLCERIWNVSSADVLRIGSPHLMRLFDERYFIRSIAACPSKIAEIRRAFPNVQILRFDQLQIEESKS